MNEKQRIILLAAIEAAFVLVAMAFIDAYICVYLFGSGTPNADYSKIPVWWNASLIALLAASATVAIAAMLGDWGAYSREDWAGFAMLLLTPAILIFTGLFDLASALWHFALWGKNPVGVLEWAEWGWLDGQPILFAISRAMGHPHVLFHDLLLGCAIGAALTLAGWMAYLKT